MTSTTLKELFNIELTPYFWELSYEYRCDALIDLSVWALKHKIRLNKTHEREDISE